MNAVPFLQANGVQATRLDLRGPEVYHLPKWRDYGDPKRVAALRQIVMSEGRDPRVQQAANQILAQCRTQSRDYQRQAACLLNWVQTNIRYINEPGEKLQSPEYTLRVGFGDCDCLAILLASFYEAVNLPWRFVLSGMNKKTGAPERWEENTPTVRGVVWSHIYLTVGWPPFRPIQWVYAEPSAQVPLGWDVVNFKRQGGGALMPEMGGPKNQVVSRNPSAVSGFGSLTDDLLEAAVSIREEMSLKRILPTIVIGTVAGIASNFAMEFIMRKWGGRSR